MTLASNAPLVRTTYMQAPFSSPSTPFYSWNHDFSPQLFAPTRRHQW